MCSMLHIHFEGVFFGGGGGVARHFVLCCVDDVYRGLKYCALLAQVKKNMFS